MSLRWRAGASLALVLLAGFLTVSNFVPEATRLANPLIPDRGLRLGLDLQGGIHWVLGVKLDVAEHQELAFMRNYLEELDADEDGWALESVSVDGNRLTVSAPSVPASDALAEWVEDNGGLSLVSQSGDRYVYELSDVARANVRQRGMDQVLEVLRRRIGDPAKGIPESVVTRQGADRVLVQIPGGQIDRANARSLLKVTGFLQFKIVRDEGESVELLEARYADRGGIGDDREIVTEREKETERVLTAFLVDKEPALTGDYLTDARVRFDRQQRPYVAFTFNSEGGRLFGELSGANIGERLAIVLDDRVYSAPVIRSRIGAQGQIEGRFSSQEAADLAVVLRSGSLPIPVEIEEERTVGPALGADSISAGLRASVLGLVVIVAFALGYYRLSGGYASLALLANLLMLGGVMSLSGSTLTLPGIAGIVLTVGMAIDANVIIFERIREELRAQKTPRGAIATGFNKAFWTIMDANITTLITAVVLYEYGTGPIKGFAVTLSIGVVTSVFAALVLTRLMFHLYPGNRPVASLSI